MAVKTKNFIAITSAVDAGKTVMLVASNGRSIRNAQGITFEQAMQFFFELRNTTQRAVFICYAFTRDLEFLFQSLSSDAKDKLFQSHRVRKQIDIFQYDLEQIESDLYRVEKDTQEFEQLDFERYVSQLALRDLSEVNHNGYALKIQGGKRLIITHEKRDFSLYDVFGFFRKSIYEAAQIWLGETNELLRERPPLDIKDKFESLKQYALIEVDAIKRLTIKLDSELRKNGIQLSRFHGAGAVASWMLGKGKARTSDRKTTQYHNYRYRRQLSEGLYRAMMQAYYGGRAEQLKIGTFKQSVYVYDINSAYAYAASFLPYLLSKPKHVREWNNSPFSLWYCDYDFTKAGLYYGLLPNREMRTNFTTYKMRGRGFFWQPEVAFIAQHYPQCIDIQHGYTVDYKRAPFTDVILEMYELRKELELRKHPLAKVLKLALASIYGKFCQSRGKGFYYNMFYAGFITSVTRRQLLEAAFGNEQKVICFLTDAIHTTEPLAVKESLELGEYKRTDYIKGEYIDNGIYRLTNAQGQQKIATRGYRTLDFDKALEQMAQTRQYEALTEYFIGHNLYSLSPIMYYNYLQLQSDLRRNEPLESNARKYINTSADLRESFIDSIPYNRFAGLESGVFRAGLFKDADTAKDAIAAGRI